MRKQLLLLKTLLVAALLGMGTSAWADVPTYTWNFTNTTTWTTAKVSTGSAVTFDNNGVASGGAGYTGYGVTFNLTNETGGYVGWKYYNSKNGATCFWFNENGNANANTVSITVPDKFKVTVDLLVGSSTRPFGVKRGGTSSTTNVTPYEYTNDTGADVTISFWATNGLNNTLRMNGIKSIVLEDFSAVASHTWSAKAYATINEVKTEIDSWDAGGAEYSESETYNVWAKKVISYDGHYYELNDAKFAANAVSFSTTMGNADAAHEITYTRNDNIAFYTEGEVWDNKSQITNSLVASAGQYVHYYNGTKDVDITDAGVYVMETNVLSRGGDSGLRVYDNDYNILAGFYRDGTGFKQTARFYTAASSTIKVGYYGGNTAGIDYVLIRKITEASDAIAECKTYETSAAFATHIDGLYAAGSLKTAAEVYAAHTAWQIAQAKASGSTDYSAVILNHAVTSTGRYWGTLSDGASAPYTGAPDNYYLYNTEGSEYSVWNGVYGLPAGKYTATTYTYSSIAGDRNQYIATLEPWTDINTAAKGGSRETANDAGWVKVTSTFVLDATNNLAFGVYNPAVTGRVAGFDNWTLTKTAEYVTVSDAGYATYVPDYDLDFSETAIEAYTVKVSSQGVATLTQVNNVPAGTPVLLYKEGGANEYVPVTTGAAAVSDNDLVAGTGAAVATTAGDYTNMILNNGEDGIGFYFANDKTVAANRAYLHIATTLAPNVQQSRLKMAFAGETTGISDAALKDKGQMINDKVVFNLNGQRVKKAAKGLYIVNGKKYVK